MAGSIGYIQFAYENTGAATPPGNESVNPTASTKKLFPPVVGMQCNFNPTLFTRDDEIRGLNEALAVLPDQFNPSLTVTVPMYPDTLAFFLKAVTDTIATTAGDGIITDPDTNTIPASAYRHVFVAPGGSGAVPVTLNVKAVYGPQPSTVIAFEARGCAVTNIAFATNGARIEMTITLTPTSFLRISDPSLTAAYESVATVHPFRESDITIPTWLASTGINESGGFDFAIDKPVQTHRTMAIKSFYPDYIDKGDGMITITGNIDKRYLAVADIDAAVANTGFATKVKYQTDSFVTGSYKYAMWLETTNTQMVDLNPADLTNTRNIGGKFPWKSTNGTGTAGSWTITVVNATSSYAST